MQNQEFLKCYQLSSDYGFKMLDSLNKAIDTTDTMEKKNHVINSYIYLLESEFNDHQCAAQLNQLPLIQQLNFIESEEVMQIIDQESNLAKELIALSSKLLNQPDSDISPVMKLLVEEIHDLNILISDTDEFIKDNIA